MNAVASVMFDVPSGRVIARYSRDGRHMADANGQQMGDPKGLHVGDASGLHVGDASGLHVGDASGRHAGDVVAAQVSISETLLHARGRTMTMLEYARRRTMNTMNPQADAYTPRRFTVEEYYKMVDADILGPNDPVELIDGTVVVREPPSPSHVSRVLRLTTLLTSALGDQALVSIQNPLQVGKFDMPEPDIAVLKYREDFYEPAHPEPDDVLLLAEVALSSLQADHRTKVPLYARAGIREFWIVNIPDLMLEVFRRPTVKGYRSVTRLTRDERVVLETFPNLELNVREILG